MLNCLSVIIAIVDSSKLLLWTLLLGLLMNSLNLFLSQYGIWYLTSWSVIGWLMRASSFAYVAHWLAGAFAASRFHHSDLRFSTIII